MKLPDLMLLISFHESLINAASGLAQYPWDEEINPESFNAAKIAEDVYPTSYGTTFVLSQPYSDVMSRTPSSSVLWTLQIINPVEEKVNVYIKMMEIFQRNVTISTQGSKLIHVFPYDGFREVGLSSALFLKASHVISVISINNGQSLEGLLAVPIAAFGKTYILATLSGNPMFHIISSQDDTHVAVKFSGLSESDDLYDDFNVTFGKQSLRPGSTLSLVMKDRFVSFQFHDCHNNVTRNSDVTGSRVISNRPIGVISGNCFSKHRGIPSFKSHLEGTSEPIHSKVRILSEVPTSVVCWINTRKSILNIGGQSPYQEMVINPGMHIYLTSQTRLGVIMFWPDDNDKVKGHMGMLQIVPVENWLNWYLISVPKILKKRSFMYLVAVLLTKELPGLRIDYTYIDSNTDVLRAQDHSGSFYVEGFAIYTVLHYRAVHLDEKIPGFTAVSKLFVNDTYHVIYHLDRRTFGCYAKVVMTTGRIFYQLGMAFRKVEELRTKCKDRQEYMVGQDGLDNDCDGFVDEEIFNHKSDDLDEFIDEDLGVVHGGWAAWSEKPSCSVPCRGQDGLMAFTRTCTNPEPSQDGRQCQGDEFKPVPGPRVICNTKNVKCPHECRNGTWSYGCSQQCSPGCDDVCNKLTGKCRKCFLNATLSPDGMCSPDNLFLLAQKSETGSDDRKAEVSDAEKPGWMIYSTVTSIALLICVGIVYEIFKKCRTLKKPPPGKKDDDDDDDDD